MTNTATQEALFDTKIVASIDDIVFRNDENDYAVLRMKEKDSGAFITAVGHIPSLPAGSTIELCGRWEQNPKYRQEQFKFDAYRMVIPDSISGLKRYLSSGLIKGIGKSIAKKIVDHFGFDTVSVLNDAPERLAEIDGLGIKRIESIKEAWEAQRDIQDIMLFLQSVGISSSYASRIFRHYGKQAALKVQQNPYQLTDVWGIGFSVADRIAKGVGIPQDSPLRIKAGVVYSLSEACKNGHCYLPTDDLVKKASDYLTLGEDSIRMVLQTLAEDNKLVIDATGRAYPPVLYVAETGVAKRITEILGSPVLLPNIEAEKAIPGAESELDVTLAASQRQAIAQFFNSHMSIVTGGPGTGKSTLLKVLVKILRSKKVSIGLVAPTGRAAKRMSEITGEEAMTIHRLLEYDPVMKGFRYNETRRLPIDVLIVDETSMLDIILCHSLLKAVMSNAAILFIGDVDQLPSVSSGNVLKDIIDAGVVPVTRLTQVFRQSEGSLININAQRVNRGEFVDLRPDYKGMKDFYFIYRETPEEILDEIISLVKTRLPLQFGFDPIKDIQVLSAMHKGVIGTTALNEVIQRHLNQSEESFTRGSKTFKLGDKVMQIRNNYDEGKEVFNGDLGIIEEINQDDEVLIVNFDGRLVEYDFQNDLDDLVLSYAMTVHKSQGGEYKAVIIPFHTTHFIMLKRNWAYTAISRGKQLVICIGKKKAMEIAIKNNDSSKRFTSLAERLMPLRSAAAVVVPVTS